MTYRPGAENANVDGLSRQCWEQEDQTKQATSQLEGDSRSSGGRCGAPPQTELNMHSEITL